MLSERSRPWADPLKVTLTAVMTSGQFELWTDVVGVHVTGGAIGDEVALEITGGWDCPKATGQAWTVGQNLYWDDTAKNFTTTATANTLAGVAIEAAASGAAVGVIRLNGVGA